MPLQCHSGIAASHVSQQKCETWFEAIRTSLGVTWVGVRMFLHQTSHLPIRPAETLLLRYMATSYATTTL